MNRFSEFNEFEDNVERINVKDVSCQEFIDRFEKLYKPVVVEGMQVSHSILLFIEFQKKTSVMTSLVCLYVRMYRKVGRQTKNGLSNDWPKNIEIKSSNVAKTMKDTALR